MANGNGGAVEKASADANQNMTASPAGSAVQSCGAETSSSSQTVDSKKKSWIAIKLVDETNHPVPTEPYRIVLADGSAIEGVLDARGSARINGIDPGSCRVSFPNRNAPDWKHL